MKSLIPELLSHLSQKVLTVAFCIRIDLLDKTIGLTNCNNSFDIDKVTYQATQDMKLEYLQYDGTESSALICATIGTFSAHWLALLKLYDLAKVTIMIVNYRSATKESTELFNGSIAALSQNGYRFCMQLTCTMPALSNKVGKLFSPQCRAKFCDTQCKLQQDTFTFSSTVDAVFPQEKAFLDQKLTEADEYYKHGLVSFQSGSNRSTGHFEVKDYLDKTLYLARNPPFPIVAGDQYSVIAGCDKRFRTCCIKFNNSANFRGEPHIPDMNSIYRPSDE